MIGRRGGVPGRRKDIDGDQCLSQRGQKPRVEVKFKSQADWTLHNKASKD